MALNIIAPPRRIARRPIPRNAVVEQRRLEARARLLLREARGQVQRDPEQAAVEIRHRPPEIGDGPDEGVGVDELNVEGDGRVALVRLDDLFVLALEVGGDAAVFFLLGEALDGPAGCFGVEGGLDGLEAAGELGVVELADHVVALAFEGHAGEELAVGDFFAGFADGEEVGVVVPEEAALAEVFEGLEGCEGFVRVIVEGVGVGVVGDGGEDGSVGGDAEVFF